MGKLRWPCFAGVTGTAGPLQGCAKSGVRHVTSGAELLSRRAFFSYGACSAAFFLFRGRRLSSLTSCRGDPAFLGRRASSTAATAPAAPSPSRKAAQRRLRRRLALLHEHLARTAARAERRRGRAHLRGDLHRGEETRDLFRQLRG